MCTAFDFCIVHVSMYDVVDACSVRSFFLSQHVHYALLRLKSDLITLKSGEGLQLSHSVVVKLLSMVNPFLSPLDAV